MGLGLKEMLMGVDPSDLDIIWECRYTCSAMAGLRGLAISLDEFIITFFNIGGGNTLPTFVFGKIRTSLDPTINAIATILIVLTVGSTVLALRLSRYRA